MNNINISDSEKNITSALISGLSNLEEIPTREMVEEKARIIAEVFCYEGPLEPIVEETLVAIDTRMGAGVSLVDLQAKHDDEWVYKRDNIDWVYSDAYDRYLKSEKWSPSVVQKLSDVSMNILGLLQDPTSEGSWDRRGLVIGHVQSGKTANYLGLVAKAADAGYKFVIVIAGLHNILRKQTQERIDAGFIGRSSDPENRVPIGVGMLSGKYYPNPATLTNIYNDFNKATASQSGWMINDFSKPIVLVIKKNVNTLDSLYKWLKELNTQGDGKISDVPMIMIDDEADHASINTNKEELDPTRTNEMIRKIIGLFEKSCYIGYTATPFANIFINPDSYDEEAYEELFPKDFVYCLDAPTNYFGPDKVFIDDINSKKYVIEINDAEEYIPLSHKKYYDILDLPPSLYESINQFIISKTLRNLRKQKNKHTSMMINVSRFVQVQNTVRDLISAYEKKLREAVKSNYRMPESIALSNKYMNNLKGTFFNNYDSCEFSWDEVKKNLNNAFDHLRIYVINSKSQDSLNYSEYARDNIGLTAIAIGGLSLSRGLTIEGLCVSYMYRNTRMYDTLMQMGRWFGYRPGYEDLCRIHLNSDSISWYEHIADASEELRQQIKQMRRDKLSPRQFGLYVRAHPDSLLITAANKMRYSEKVKFKQNYSGRLIESYILPDSEAINIENTSLIKEYWMDGFTKGREYLEKTKKGWIIRDVSVEIVEDFLIKFRPHFDFAEIKSAAVSYLRAISEDHQFADVLLISIKSKEREDEPFKLGSQERESAKLIDDSAWKLSKNRVASRGDESLGLSSSQIRKAEMIAAESEIDKKPSDFHFRSVRKKPLLMLHMLDLGRDRRPDVPAFGISFPTGNYDREIEVVANKVWIERMHAPIFDNSDDDEDDLE